MRFLFAAILCLCSTFTYANEIFYKTSQETRRLLETHNQYVVGYLDA